MTRTLNSTLSDAEICRRNGWDVGTVLVGEEDDGEISILQITAVGLGEVLSVDVDDDGELGSFECLTCLSMCNWKERKLEHLVRHVVSGNSLRRRNP